MPRLTSALLALALATPALAAPAAGPAASPMREIFALSGLDAQLRSLPEVLDQSVGAQCAQLPEAHANAVRRAATREFATPALRDGVLRRLEAAYHARHASAALEWLRSPLGRRITQLEIAAGSAEGMRRMAAFAESARVSPPPAARVELVDRLDRAIDATRIATDLALASTEAAAVAANAALPAAQRRPEAELRRLVSQQEGALRAQSAALIRLSFLYTYQPLGDAELGAYLAFAQSESGRWYHAVTSRAVIAAMRDASGRAGAAIARELQDVPARAR
jgi:hypothetical protein